MKKCILAVNPADISAVASSIPFRYLQRLIEALTELLEGSPFLEFILRWCQVCIKLLTNLTENCSVIRSFSAYMSPNCLYQILFWQEICKVHGHSIQQNSKNLLPTLKSLQKAITSSHQDLADMCSSNEYTLRYLCASSVKI